ncbi:protein O-GlcNAcase-like [Mytilus edulis]|uniref:protein O-GlcNAcase-like n=1 Tax=Mytilus edulis TaxID=6550 RepID=UPI0039F13DC3
MRDLVNSGLNNESNQRFICGAVEGFYGRPWSSDQRKLLFKWLKKMGLNTYMYAPKDDCKHRAFWRELYSVEEADNLTSLIQSATENNIEFVYAVSPGLDISFSSAKDLQCLKRKLEQVSTFGCNAFALLFDDIDPELSESDKSMFTSSAAAQVSITNEVFQHLEQPHFYFCPTEYCSSRALPTLSSSEYLNTVGSKLLSAIEILWTGVKVVSKKMTIKHLEEVTAVFRRPPLIWDNIHANDYDPRRIYLGAYDGRSPEIIPYLRGVLTNPNTEFESNYVALHSLGQWCKSNPSGLKKDVIFEGDLLSPVISDIKLETDSDFGSVEDIPSLLDTRYQPRVALRLALSDWMIELKTPRTQQPMPAPLTAVLPTNVAVISELQNGSMVNVGGGDSFMQPVMLPINNSLLSTGPELVSDSESDTSVELEPMDCVPSANVSTTSEEWSNDGKMTVEPEVRMEDFTCDDIQMIVDFFFLPFEHGIKSSQLLDDLHWLKSNSHLVMEKKEQTPEMGEWMTKANSFTDSVKMLRAVSKRLVELPNISAVQELFPYAWDLLGILETCSGYVSWLGKGCANANGLQQQALLAGQTWSSHGYKEAFMSGDQEPWVFRGGVQGELQKLMPIDFAHDLFLIRAPEVVLNKFYHYRPYSAADEAAVYNICLKTCDDGLDGTEVFPGYPDLIGDRIVGSTVSQSSEYCFVVEDDEGICGYACAALDTKVLQQKSALSWMPAMREKYPRTIKGEQSPADEVISSFHGEQHFVPESVHNLYPACIRIDFIPPRVVDHSVPKRLLACAMAALKTNGATGIHVEMNIGDKSMIDHYQRLGFTQLTVPDIKSEDVVYLGRMISFNRIL